jgi:1,2-diacylglycerol 3-beta-galactosyltransferase
MVETANRKKVLILSADAGLGHHSAAEALRDALRLQYGDLAEVEINNPLDHPKTPKFIRKSQIEYDEIVKNLPDLYEMGYELSDGTLPVSLLEGGLIVTLYDPLRQIVLTQKPDLILSTYPLYQAPLSTVLDLNGLASVPLVAAVTDLVTVHHVWFNTHVTRCAIPTEAVKQKALEAGLREDQLILSGIPVNPAIGQLKQSDPKALRQEIGLDSNLTTVLVVASPRLNDLEERLTRLDQLEADFQWVLISGGYETLYQTLQEMKWRHPAQVFNFVEEMPKFLCAADLILCKAGGLIVTESLAAGLPLLLIHALPGQETGNVDYVVSHQAGAFCPATDQLYQTFSNWLAGDKARLAAIATNADKLGKPNAAEEIVKQAWALIKEHESHTPLNREHPRIHGLNALLQAFDINPEN